MMRLRVVREITAMSFREFLRTPEAVFWSYGFPLVMALVLGIAFSRGTVPEVRVGVVSPAAATAEDGGADPASADGGVSAGDGGAAGAEAADAPTAAERLMADLAHHGGGRLTLVALDADEAGDALRRGKVDMLVRPAPELREAWTPSAGGAAPPFGVRLEFDPTRPESELARSQVELALIRRDYFQFGAPALPVEPVVEPGSRYIDFLIPGLIGLNLLGSGLFGIGFGLVQMRVHKMLRRLAVTPMRRSEFLAGFLLGRIVLTVPETAVLVAFGVFVFGVPLDLVALPLFALVVLLGALTFAGLGLLVASRARTIEAVSGLMNVAMLPMWLLGGCFFSVERFPDFFWPVIACVPMHWLTDALRAVMLAGDGLGEVWLAVLVLLGWTVATFLAALRLFRWQ